MVYHHATPHRFCNTLLVNSGYSTGRPSKRVGTSPYVTRTCSRARCSRRQLTDIVHSAVITRSLLKQLPASPNNLSDADTDYAGRGDIELLGGCTLSCPPGGSIEQ
jgi:hypothetical protein